MELGRTESKLMRGGLETSSSSSRGTPFNLYASRLKRVLSVDIIMLSGCLALHFCLDYVSLSPLIVAVIVERMTENCYV